MPTTTSTYEPLVLVDTADLPEDEWLEYRRRGIGGSDAAAILGVSPFATARDLYYDKLKVVSYEDLYISVVFGVDDTVSNLFNW
ncbi:MAG: YqaJ viral recombinase family protein [Clostridia bacterium]|nr:YqaJ viral recombinase family protein [Clostridia bacterium]